MYVPDVRFVDVETSFRRFAGRAPVLCLKVHVCNTEVVHSRRVKGRLRRVGADVRSPSSGSYSDTHKQTNKQGQRRGSTCKQQYHRRK